MDVTNFLRALEKNEMIDYSVVCFTGSSYPLLFFSLVINRLRQHYGDRVKKIEAAQFDNSSIQASLNISFLGQTLLYWCGDSKQVAASKSKQFLADIKYYEGPHSVWFFTDTWEHTPNAKQCIIQLHEIDKAQTMDIIRVLMPELQDYSLITYVFEKKAMLTLETVCLLLHYSFLIGRKQLPEFTTTLLDKIIVPEQSLFTLSTHFFAKNPTLFFQVWRAIEHDYVPLFWISFWSDQLFRASNFIALTKQKNLTEAKKIAHKLPFTFIKRDWQKVTIKELNAAHNTLYHLDYTLKQGGSEHFLNLFFVNFFSNTSHTKYIDGM